MRQPIPHELAPVFLFLGALAMVGAALAFRSQRRFLSKSVRATGVVQDLRKERIDRTTYYFPIIRFATPAGVTVTAESKTGKTCQIGQSIGVLYDPDHPDNFEIDAFWSRWLLVFFAAFFALVLFLLGLGTMLSSSPPPPKPLG